MNDSRSSPLYNQTKAVLAAWDEESLRFWSLAPKLNNQMEGLRAELAIVDKALDALDEFRNRV